MQKKLEPIKPKTDFSKVESVVYLNVDEEKAKGNIANQRKRYTNIEVGLAVLGTFV